MDEENFCQKIVEKDVPTNFMFFNITTTRLLQCDNQSTNAFIQHKHYIDPIRKTLTS